MKAAITLLILTLGFTFVSRAQQVQTGAVISVNKEVHDYGTVKAGSDGMCEFVVTNNGNEPLVLATVKGSCSCTVPSYPTEPIAPGASAVIKVKYNTDHVGPINKSVTITSNAVNEQIKVVKISGNVIAAAEGTSPVVKDGAPANQ